MRLRLRFRLWPESRRPDAEDRRRSVEPNAERRCGKGPGDAVAVDTAISVVRTTSAQARTSWRYGEIGCALGACGRQGSSPPGRGEPGNRGYTETLPRM